MLVASASVCALLAPAAAAVDIYAYANGCYALKDAGSNRFVVRDALGYSASAPTAALATPFRMQATDLGSYMLYGPDQNMPGADTAATVSPSAAPGPPADWRLTDEGDTVMITSVSTQRQLGVGPLDRVVQVDSTTPR